MYNPIEEYTKMVHELIEVPRNELRRMVYGEHKMEYQELLEKYEQAYFEKCLKIEEMLEEEYQERKKNQETIENS